MVLEFLIAGTTLVILFAPWLHAKAAELREKVRQMEIENDKQEFMHEEDI